MRLIGNLESGQHANHFAGYLVAQGIHAEIEELDSGGWAVWVHEENQLEQAREELQRFREAPDDERYQGLTAPRMKKVSAPPPGSRTKPLAPRRRVVVQQPWDFREFSGRNWFTIGLILITVAASVNAGFSLQTPLGSKMSFCSLESVEDGLSPLYSIQQGEYWRLLTPALMHLSFNHLLFNMLFLYYFGSQIEDIQGTLTVALLVFAIALISNAAQALSPQQPEFEALSGNPNFGGMSGVVYGLFGYVWVRMMVTPHSAFFAPPLMVFVTVGWFMWCFVDPAGNVANLAHMAGLMAGIVAGGVYGLASGEDGS